MALEFISWADYRCVLQQFSSLTRLKGSWGQVCPESGRKPTKTNLYFSFLLRPLVSIGFRVIADRRANQAVRHLQPGLRPKLEIVYIWGVNGPDRLPKPRHKGRGLRLPLFGRGLQGPRGQPDPQNGRFPIRNSTNY